jgi:hypothetical protein
MALPLNVLKGFLVQSEVRRNVTIRRCMKRWRDAAHVSILVRIALIKYVAAFGASAIVNDSACHYGATPISLNVP